ncbi:MAG: chemotaxis response regulator protein-glutamate methylesterase [Myxococcales bacterium]|nr:chemotaxis response regulator protein-glutamate methylesterase [Myxococcales bacterium]
MGAIAQATSAKPIRILVVDDAALVRKMLKEGLARAQDLEVVGAARDPYEARDMLVKLRPDVMTLDIEMPKMDGLEFLRRLMPQFPIPTVVVSSLSQKGSRMAIDAMAAGAVDVVGKPSRDLGYRFEQMMDELQVRVRNAAKVNRSLLRCRIPQSGPPKAVRSNFDSTDKVIAIGSSTGGTEALFEILREMPVNSPATVIVQHMPPGFTKALAARLDSQVALTVKEAEHGDRLSNGRVLLAPAGQQCRVVRSGGHYQLALKTAPPVRGHCPSVDVLMHSMAQQVGRNGVGVILTGMGRDGAEGLKLMRESGAKTIGQDEATSVVYGMPKVAKELGAVERQVPLSRVAGAITVALKGRAGR